MTDEVAIYLLTPQFLPASENTSAICMASSLVGERTKMMGAAPFWKGF